MVVDCLIMLIRKERLLEVILTGLVLVACAQSDISSDVEADSSVGARATPLQFNQSPQSTQTASPFPSASVCHVFVSERNEQIGGIPTLINNLYVAKSGIVQKSQERSDDFVLALRQGIVDIYDILDKVEQLQFHHQLTETITSEGSGVILSEYYGPTITFEISYCDSSTKQSIFPVDVIPPDFQEILLLASRLVESLPVERLVRGQKYIRSQRLLSDQAKYLLEAGLIIEINVHQLADAPFIQQGITYERKLIQVSSEEVYGPIPLSFTHGRSAHISWNNQVYQIRHLLTK